MNYRGAGAYWCWANFRFIHLVWAIFFFRIRPFWVGRMEAFSLWPAKSFPEWQNRVIWKMLSEHQFSIWMYFFFSPFSRRFVHSPRLAPRPDYGISEDFPSEKCNKKAIIKYLFLHNETVYSDESSYAKFLLSDPRWFHIDPSIPVVQHYSRIWNGSRKKSHPNEIFRMLNLCSLRCIFLFFVAFVRFWPLVAMFHLCQDSSISLNLWRKAIWSTDMKKKITLPLPPMASGRRTSQTKI